MPPEQIRNLRLALDLTQEQFAQLVGVHSLTVSKWERGILTPNARQVALMKSFKKAARNQPDIGAVLGSMLIGAGIAAALYFVLKAAFAAEEEDFEDEIP